MQNFIQQGHLYVWDFLLSYWTFEVNGDCLKFMVTDLNWLDLYIYI